MNILDMPIEWQQRSANTFSMPMPVKKIPYFQWLNDRDLPASAASLVAGSTSLESIADSVPAASGAMGTFISKNS
jgi:hypothetical protein